MVSSTDYFILKLTEDNFHVIKNQEINSILMLSGITACTLDLIIRKRKAKYIKT